MIISTFVLRLLIAFFSIALALIAGISANKDELIKSIHNFEDKKTIQSKQARDLITRKDEVIKKIAENNKELNNYSNLEKQKDYYLRLADMECHGRSGYDEVSGKRIIGGGICGANARTYRINAKHVNKEIERLDRIKEENKKLNSQINALEQEYDQLFIDRRSPINSSSALYQAATKHADFSTIFLIVFTILIIGTIELFAFFISLMPIQNSIKDVIKRNEAEDERRVNLESKKSKAQFDREYEKNRHENGKNLDPLKINIDEFDANKSDNKSKEEQSELAVSENTISKKMKRKDKPDTKNSEND